MRRFFSCLLFFPIFPSLGILIATPEAPPPETTVAEADFPSSHAVLVEAIEERRILEFVYDGLPRRVEPHTYGRSREGSLILVAYRIGGESHSGKPEGWHLFSVQKITELKPTDLTFSETRPGYNPDDPRIPTPFARLPATAPED